MNAAPVATAWYCAALRSLARLLVRAADLLDAWRHPASGAVRLSEPGDDIARVRDRILSRFH